MCLGKSFGTCLLKIKLKFFVGIFLFLKSVSCYHGGVLATAFPGRAWPMAPMAPGLVPRGLGRGLGQAKRGVTMHRDASAPPQGHRARPCQAVRRARVRPWRAEGEARDPSGRGRNPRRALAVADLS